MKIYTKTGDSGTTSLTGGKRVPKCDKRIEAAGNVDELISWVGLIRDQKIDHEHIDLLIEIQDRLMSCAYMLALDHESCKVKTHSIREEDIVALEIAIDRMEEELDPVQSFILPGGHSLVSWCHIARNVCRRAERNVLRLHPDFPLDNFIVKYLNRLSDYFFVLSRKIGKDFNADEIPWKLRL